MGLGVRVVGQAGKRGIIPRVPTGERLLADVEAWLRNEYADTIITIDRPRPAAGELELRLTLHPAARPVTLTANDTGRTTGRAETASVGPGYHTFVCRLLERLGEEHSISWAGSESEPGAIDDLGTFGSTDRASAEQTVLAWLRASLTRAREARSIAGSGLQLGTPVGVRYSFDGALATALGPRDDAWLDRALAEPRVAIDVLPWWADATDARYGLNRALSLMWTEVRWRSPATPEERRVVDEILALLHRAHPLDPSLDYPWREWHELIELRGASVPTAALVAGRAAAAPANRPPIGYRRDPVTVVHEGWQLEIPGSFAERRGAEEWWGGEGGRSVTLAAVETAADGRPMRPEAFLAQVADGLGEDALHHRDGPIVGTARLVTESHSGISVGVLEAFSAVIGSGAAIRIEFDDPEDWQWAMELWRHLRPASADPTIDLGVADIGSGRVTARSNAMARGAGGGAAAHSLGTIAARSA